MTDNQIKTPVEARQSTKENVGRWVLGISTIVAIIAMAVIWMIVR